MARPKLDPKIKKARYEKAKQEAEKFNKKLGSHAHTNAYATEWGKVVVYYEAPGQRKVRIRAPSLPSSLTPNSLQPSRVGFFQLGRQRPFRPKNGSGRAVIPKEPSGGSWSGILGRTSSGPN